MRGGEILSVLQNFQVTVECLFVCPCSSSQFSMSSHVSSEVNHCVFRGQSRVCGCQERNFGNVHYLRDLRRHALGAQMRQAVSSGISLNATRPVQPISLGAFDPFSDMAIFGLSEMNNFRIPFSLVGGYSVLDSIMGKGWDVKPLRSDVDNCHFKYVSLFTVYLDKKNFIFFFFYFTILVTGRTLTLLTIQITILTFKLILQLLVTSLILKKSIYMHYLQYIYYNTFLQYTMILKVPLTPKIFLSRQKGPFCSDHIGEKIIVVRFFLDFL